MKICVFSDIHGNGPAFRTALPCILAESADLHLFLGDICGYYYDQLDIFSMFAEIPNLTAILGNHDKIFLEIRAGNRSLLENYRRKYGKSMDHLLAQDHQRMTAWLLELGTTYQGHGTSIRCFHGSPADPLRGYVYPDTLLDPAWQQDGVTFLGHTHYRMARKHGRGLFVNPGSLGQPRDGGMPSYAVTDFATGRTTFREVHYDPSPLIERIEAIGDQNPYLRKVLERGSK